MATTTYQLVRSVRVNPTNGQSYTDIVLHVSIRGAKQKDIHFSSADANPNLQSYDVLALAFDETGKTPTFLQVVTESTGTGRKKNYVTRYYAVLNVNGVEYKASIKPTSRSDADLLMMFENEQNAKRNAPADSK